MTVSPRVEADSIASARNLCLYAVITFGKDGPFHSFDYPKVWKTKAAALRYKKQIPPVKRSIYQILKFVAQP